MNVLLAILLVLVILAPLVYILGLPHADKMCLAVLWVAGVCRDIMAVYIVLQFHKDDYVDPTCVAFWAICLVAAFAALIGLLVHP